MKGLLCCCLILIAAGLSACASQSDMRQAAAPPANTATSDGFRNDAAYMFQVEHIARRRGVGVHWVNPPLKRPNGGIGGTGLE